MKNQRPSIAQRANTVVELLLTVALAFVLFGLMGPFGSHTARQGTQTKSLAQAKQIGLALKLYAGDHDGVFPAGKNTRGQTIISSNDAFRSLFPEYTQSEKLFGNKLSAWQQSPPDDVISPASETLKPGENVYAYVTGVTDAADPYTPLVADGTDGTGHYTTNRAAWGGTWDGKRAIVIRLDNSGSVEKLTGPDNALYIARLGDPKHHLLEVESYAGPGVWLLDPAPAPNKSL